VAGLLEGKRILVAGVLTEASIGYATAKVAQQEGATVIVTNFGRALSITRRIVKRLPAEPVVLELDVTDAEHMDSLADRLREHVDGLDGIVHAIGFAPQNALGADFTEVPWSDAGTALHVSTWSLAGLVQAARPLLANPSSVVGLNFDAQVAWPAYGWMGVAKAGLESCARYLARELGPDGVRVNLISAGPLRTMAAKSIPGFSEFEDVWDTRAPLGWSLSDLEPAARGCVALLSDFFPATTGEVVHVDGGFHAVGV